MSDESEKVSEPQHKRRWYQYSLRSLMILMTVLCIWLGYLSNEARKQRNVVAWVEDKLGAVRYDYEYIENVGWSDNEPPGPDWLREWIGIDYFCDVTGVVILGGNAIDLTPLKDLVALESLIVFNTPVLDLSPLEVLTNLKEVKLIWTSVTKEDVQKLQKALPNCDIDRGVK